MSESTTIRDKSDAKFEAGTMHNEYHSDSVDTFKECTVPNFCQYKVDVGQKGEAIPQKCIFFAWSSKSSRLKHFLHFLLKSGENGGNVTVHVIRLGREPGRDNVSMFALMRWRRQRSRRPSVDHSTIFYTRWR